MKNWLRFFLVLRFIFIFIAYTNPLIKFGAWKQIIWETSHWYTSASLMRITARLYSRKSSLEETVLPRISLMSFGVKEMLWTTCSNGAGTLSQFSFDRYCWYTIVRADCLLTDIRSLCLNHWAERDSKSEYSLSCTCILLWEGLRKTDKRQHSSISHFQYTSPAAAAQPTTQ